MAVFLLIWILLLGAVSGLAVGALWGRELRKGGCAGQRLAGGRFAECQGCTQIGSATHETPKCGR